MVRVYVRERGETPSLSPPRKEVRLERIEGASVEELIDAIAQQTNLDKQELHLMYGGRILKCGNTLDHYQIKDGCTLHVMQRKKKLKYAPLPNGPEGMTVVFLDPNIQSEIAPFIRDPELVASMVPMGDPTEIKEVLEDPDLLAKISDMARINHYLRRNHMLLPVMKALLRLHRIKYSVQDSGRMDHLSVQVGQILELASASDLEPMVVPSEASTAHPGPGLQLIHGTIHSVIPGSSENSAASGAVPGGDGEDEMASVLPSLGVTPADLESALASIGAEQSDSQLSSMSGEPSSQPLSLPLFPPNVTGSSAPASLQEADLLSVPPTVARSLSDSGRGDTGTRRDASISGAVSISELDLRHALSRVISSAQEASSQPTTSRSPRSPSSRRHHQSHRHSPRQQTLRERYTAHLEQLHAMGITYSDSECLHALEAAQGDLQTALEILMGH